MDKNHLFCPCTHKRMFCIFQTAFSAFQTETFAKSPFPKCPPKHLGDFPRVPSSNKPPKPIFHGRRFSLFLSYGTAGRLQSSINQTRSTDKLSALLVWLKKSGLDDAAKPFTQSAQQPEHLLSIHICAFRNPHQYRCHKIRPVLLQSNGQTVGQSRCPDAESGRLQIIAAENLFCLPHKGFGRCDFADAAGEL